MDTFILAEAEKARQYCSNVLYLSSEFIINDEISSRFPLKQFLSWRSEIAATGRIHSQDGNRVCASTDLNQFARAY